MPRGATFRSSGRATLPTIRSRASSSRTRPRPAFSVEKIQNKMALKVVQNGQITMENCRVPEENRLQGDKSFRDTAKVLRGTRYFVSWEATGCAMGAYENALKYAQERLQFGKPIGSFQLMQDLLAKMLGQYYCFAVPGGSHGSTGGRRKNDRRTRGAFESVLHGQVPRDGRVGARGDAAETASPPTTTWDGSSPMPKRSTPTKARIRCRT